MQRRIVQFSLYKKKYFLPFEELNVLFKSEVDGSFIFIFLSPRLTDTQRKKERSDIDIYPLGIEKRYDQSLFQEYDQIV